MTEEANVCMEILLKAAHVGSSFDCHGCPAYAACPTGTAGWNNECIFDTAADLIESLSAELEQVKRERDAAVETMAENPRCETCKHYTPGYFCLGCKRGDKWQWRGVKEE